MSDLSRRNLLKRLGVGTAVGWSAPVVASIGTTAAFAASANPCTDVALADAAEGGEGFACTGCLDPVSCGSSSSGFGCFCLIRTQNECCVCIEPRNCPGQGAPSFMAQPCDNNNDCTGSQAGWICVYSCCNGSPILGTPRLIPKGFKGTCAKPCPSPGVFSAAAAASNSRLSAGGSQVG